LAPERETTQPKSAWQYQALTGLGNAPWDNKQYT
jgi:hypothetical protein